MAEPRRQDDPGEVPRPTHTVFISHEQRDAPLADAIAELLRSIGVNAAIRTSRTVKDALGPDGDYTTPFRKQVRDAAVHLAVVTPAAARSRFLEAEWSVARVEAPGATTIPLAFGIETSELPSPLREFQGASGTNPDTIRFVAQLVLGRVDPELDLHQAMERFDRSLRPYLDAVAGFLESRAADGEASPDRPAADVPAPPDSPSDRSPSDVRNAGPSLPNEPGPGGMVPWSDLEPIRLSAGAAAVLSGAAAATRDTRSLVTSALVLLEMEARGRPAAVQYWAADLLRRELRGAGAGWDRAREDYLKRKGIQVLATDAERLPQHVSRGTAAVLIRAREIAQRTTSSDVVAARHLLAALLTSRLVTQSEDRRTGAVRLLEKAGIDVLLLRERMFEWLRGYGDRDDAWRELLLGSDAAPLQLAGFSADDVRGDDLRKRDHLGIERDVVALATLIAARTVVPPLSIGLFGDWGSGKTFFMRCLRQEVKELSRRARESGRMQKDEPFYKRVVQIEFNAWHYVEGNLWASLVDHIFENLDAEERPRIVEQVQKHWIDKLQFEEGARKQAEERKSAAEARVEGAEKKVQAAKDDHARMTQELAELSRQNVARAFDLSGAREVVADVVARLGLKPASDAATDLVGVLREARAKLEHGAGVVAPLLHAPDRRARRVWLLVILGGAPLLAIVLNGLLQWLGADRIASVASLATGAATVLAGTADWIRRQMGWVSSISSAIEDAQRKYDREIEGKQAGVAKQMAHLEQQLALRRQELDAAERDVAEASRRADDAKRELSEVSAGKLLASFVKDRAASSDYRKHLGVLAVVRNDFARMSDLIEAENDALLKLKEPEEEKKGESERINRIVLYIDDLDRCPPAKVVEVLQAVHLLLAFPLFVVVVGVDARWVARSLRSRYRELLGGGGGNGAEADEQPLLGAATTSDYLEKIFQIPFWLSPPDVAAARRMLQGLIAAHGVAPPEASSPERASSPDGSSPRDGAVAGAAQAPQGSGDGTQASADPAAKETGSDGATALAQAAQDTQAAAGRERGPEPVLPNVASLQFVQQEAGAILELTPLLGRSPRSLKRFVNVYRLIKAGLTPREQAAFLDARDGILPDFFSVLFLIAVDVGLPDVTPALFEAIESGARTKRLDLDALARDARVAGTTGWRTLEGWLREEGIGRMGPMVSAAPQLAKWLPRVSRFSFRAPPPGAIAADDPASPPPPRPATRGRRSGRPSRTGDASASTRPRPRAR